MNSIIRNNNAIQWHTLRRQNVTKRLTRLALQGKTCYLQISSTGAQVDSIFKKSVRTSILARENHWTQS